jgi:tRNA (guanine37-N1)-methyltransferase
VISADTMVFDIITIFPDFFDCFLKESLIKRAQKNGLIEVNIHNLRDFADGPHQVVDDKPFGGGIGMVIKVEPIFKAVSALQKVKSQKSKVKTTTQKSKIIHFTPRGKKFTQRMAADFSKLNQLILICGRYEGIDERVAKYIADENISIGNFVMLGGETATMGVIEAVSRLIPGVIGKPQLLDKRVTKQKGFMEYPQYTRPEVFETKSGKKWRVPRILLSGHHKKIEEWRKKHTKIIK